MSHTAPERKKILVEIISSAGEPFKQDPFKVSLLPSSDGTKPDVELLSESLLKNSKALKKFQILVSIYCKDKAWLTRPLWFNR